MRAKYLLWLLMFLFVSPAYSGDIGDIILDPGSGEVGEVLSLTADGYEWIEAGAGGTGYWTQTGDDLYYNDGVVAVGTTPNATGNLYSYTASTTNQSKAVWGEHVGSIGAGTAYGGYFTSTGQNDTNIGVRAIVGTPAHASTTNYGAYFESTAGIGSTTNVGIYATASGATNNYAALFYEGNVGIGTLTPTTKLYVAGVITTETGISSTEWDSAYADRLKWDGGATDLNPATAKNSLGLGLAAYREDEDVLTYGSNLPDGEAIIDYGDAHWGGSLVASTLQSGSETFNSTTGVGVTLDPEYADTDYAVLITLGTQTNIEDIGEISIESKAVDGFTVKNSGADTTSTFYWVAIPYTLVADMAYPGAGIPVSTGTGWDTSITDNHTDWDDAYGWGDHSAAGYLTAASKLDDMAAPDDNTDLNVSTSAHGLCPKLPNDDTKFLNGLGAWAVPAGGGDVVGPASNTDGYIPLWSGADSKTLADGIANNSTDWNTAFDERLRWNGGATGLVAATGRTSLGLGSAALRAAEDTLTDGANLPDGAAIIAYGDENWGGGTGYWSQSGSNIYYTSGKVSIGTTSAQAALTVAGRVQATGSTNPTGGTGVELSYDSTNSRGGLTCFDRDLSAYKDMAYNSLAHRFYVSGTERMRITGSDVGIGATSPYERLHVGGSNPRIYIGDSTAPTTTTNRLYSVSGTLYWNGASVTGGGGGGGGGFTFNADDYVAEYGYTRAAIQKAIDAADDTGGTVFIPAGTWTIDTPGLIISNTAKGVSLMGEGATDGGTVLTRAGGAFHTVSITGNAGTNYGNEISGIKFTNSAAMTAGYAHIYLDNGVSVNLHDLSLMDGYHGIMLHACISGVRIHSCQIQMYQITSTHGYAIYMDSSPSFSQISHCTITGYMEDGLYYSVGIYLASADVSIISDIYIGEVSGYDIQMTAAAQLTGVKINNCWLDNSRYANTSRGIYISGSTTYFGLITISNNTFQGQYYPYTCEVGLEIATGSNVNDVSISDNTFFGHGKQAIAVYGGSKISITGNRVLGASGSSPGTYDGINIDNGVDYLTINDNTVGGSYMSTTGTARYGISIGNSANSEYFVITGNNCSGNVTGGIIYPSAASNKSVAGNLPTAVGY